MSESYDVPLELIRLEHPLERFAGAIYARRANVVAIGSSSTRGAGASSQPWYYPSRLQTELTTKFSRAFIEVQNKGVDGQEAGDELARFKNDVFALEPNLVIWQIGTNAIVKNYDFDEVKFAITRGLARLSGQHLDVI